MFKLCLDKNSNGQWETSHRKDITTIVEKETSMSMLCWKASELLKKPSQWFSKWKIYVLMEALTWQRHVLILMIISAYNSLGLGAPFLLQGRYIIQLCQEKLQMGWTNWWKVNIWVALVGKTIYWLWKM